MPATKKTVKAPAKKSAAAPAAAKKAPAKTAASTALKPIKTSFTKASLVVHLAEQSGVEPKAVKALMAALEATMLASVHKKGLGEFAIPGLVKITSVSIPAKKKRFGKDPFTGNDRWFDAKPASIRVKARALKKLKDAAA